MTYGTPVTCRFGAPSRPGPAPERPAGVRLTEAELAAAMLDQAARDRIEALRRTPPAEREARPAAKVGTHPRASAPRVLRLLAERGPMTQTAIKTTLGMDRGQLSRALTRLLCEGLLAEEPGAMPRLWALTPAGRAQAEGTR